jgi:sterol desaturase/sphingolipid hydroxylase (fatty acid hydroxylase superfamily)
VLTPLVIEPVRALIVAAAVFLPLERFAGLHISQPRFRKGWAMDVLTGLLNGLLLYAALLVTLAAVDAGAAAAVPALRQWIETRPLLVQGVLAVLIGDLAVYGIHRLQHAVPWLWRFHAVHHSAEELDWLIAFRFHPIDLFLLRAASLGSLVALHMAPGALAIFVAVSAWQGWLVHANVRLAYGPLRLLVVSPEFHHWHHSAEREAYDKNFASLVAVWDVLFGTVFLPRERRPERYGIEEPVPAGWIGRLLYPFRQ